MIMILKILCSEYCNTPNKLMTHPISFIDEYIFYNSMLSVFISWHVKLWSSTELTLNRTRDIRSTHICHETAFSNTSSVWITFSPEPQTQSTAAEVKTCYLHERDRRLNCMWRHFQKLRHSEKHEDPSGEESKASISINTPWGVNPLTDRPTDLTLNQPIKIPDTDIFI